MKEQKILTEEVHNLSGPKIKEVRRQKGITQKELVDLLGDLGIRITPCTLSKMENQQRGITDIELAAISRSLNVPVEALIESDE